MSIKHHNQLLHIGRLADYFRIENSEKEKNKNFQIFVFEKGSGVHQINKVNHEIGIGKVSFTYPGFIHDFSDSETLNGYFISFSEDYFSENTEHKDLLYRLPFLNDRLSNFMIQLSPKQFENALCLVNDLFDEYQQKEEGYNKILLSGINILLLKLDRYINEVKEKRIDTYYTSFQIVARYKKLISLHAHQEHMVKYYAQRLNYTPNYLNSIVKEVTGNTANSLIHQYLISEIKRFLMHTKLSHKEIANELGFCDQSYMTKFFKKHTGQRPFDWYRKLLKSNHYKP